MLQAQQNPACHGHQERNGGRLRLLSARRHGSTFPASPEHGKVLWLDERPETGSIELELFGNVLSFSTTIDKLLETDEVQDGHIRRGGASENGEILLILFGDPPQEVRSFDPPFLK